VSSELYCTECGKVQFDSPGGMTCENGHGGAPGTPHKYPMCEKLREGHPQRLKLVEFMEWLSQNGLTLCTHEPTHFASHGGTYYQTTESLDNIALRFLEIDQRKLEVERRTMLERQADANAGASNEWNG
jgi:hypothetical protein